MVNLARLAALAGGALLLPGAVLAAPVEAAAAVSDGPESTDVVDRYIVTLKQGVTLSRRDAHMQWVDGLHRRSLRRRQLTGTEDRVDIDDFHAYVGKFDEATVEQIRSSPDVEAVEPDQFWQLTAEVSQGGSTWGLASISHRGPNFDNYIYDDSVSGADMYAYVIDTGIKIEHDEFGGRAVRGYNAWGGTHVDVNGHGTHVSATIGGKTYGVFKDVNLVDVKVIGTSGTTTAITLKGYQWAVDDIVAKGRASKSVINMSLSSVNSTAFNSAVAAGYGRGILTVAASGNDAVEATKRSPASAPEALTVGAIMYNWKEPGYSNYGPAVDVLAPGSEVLSAYIGSSTNNTQTLTGTSMAAPHVAGVALYLAARDGLTTPDAITSRIKELATVGAASLSWPTTPNLVLFNGNSQAA